MAATNVSINLMHFPDEVTLAKAREIVSANQDAKAVAVAKSLLDLVEDLRSLKAEVKRY